MSFLKTIQSQRDFRFTQSLSILATAAAFFLCFTLTGCARVSASTLPLGIFDTTQAISLNALNKNAENAIISDPQQSPYLYFGFVEDYSLESPFPVSALELEMTTSVASDTASGVGAGSGEFFISFLYESDFTSPTELKKELPVRKTVQGIISSNGNITISFAFDAAEAKSIRGFAVYSTIPLSVQSASIVPAKFGWVKRDGQNWIGLAFEGGIIPPELFALAGENPLETEFSGIADILSRSEQEHASRSALKVLLRDNPSDMGPLSKQNRVTLNVAGDTITIRRAPKQRSVNLDSAIFSSGIPNVSLEQNAHMVEGLILEVGANDTAASGKYTPITADPGLILSWPQSEWRYDDFELFSWESFPSVLFFDFADYALQDEFFKRLAFYVEKKGYTGRLWTHQQLEKLHAFNAQDYRAESLAAFFTQAHEEQFPLNESEVLLRNILLENGIILRNSTASPLYTPGEGAIVSISRESPDYLRTTFITHEALHGIYFVQSDFRDKVLSVHTQTDPRSLQFLHLFFGVSPSLNYDTNDDYLMKNEFMAYMLQYPTSQIGAYFADRVAQDSNLNQADSELCEYIRKTRADTFVQASHILSEFLYERWGLAAGRVTLVSITRSE